MFQTFIALAAVRATLTVAPAVPAAFTSATPCWPETGGDDLNRRVGFRVRWPLWSAAAAPGRRRGHSESSQPVAGRGEVSRPRQMPDAVLRPGFQALEQRAVQLRQRGEGEVGQGVLAGGHRGRCQLDEMDDA